MNRLTALSVLLALVALPSHAAISHGDALPVTPPVIGADLNIETLVGGFPEATRDMSDDVLLARGGRGGGGGAPRGSAAPSRQPGGYSQGKARAAQRPAAPDRDVDIDIDVDDDRDHLIEDDFVRGAVVGVVVGAAISSDDDTVVYTCPGEDQDGYCDENVAN